MFNAESPDEELMASYCKGSEQAFEVLYKRHSGKVFGFLCSRVNSEQLAVDLFQEVFVKMHRSKHLYDPNKPFLPWLFAITHSSMIDGLRKIARKNEDFEIDFEKLPPKNFSEPTDTRELNSFLEVLPANQKAALEMRYVDEKTFQEIAEALKTSPLNVRQIISRAIRRLKRFHKEGGPIGK